MRSQKPRGELYSVPLGQGKLGRLHGGGEAGSGWDRWGKERIVRAEGISLQAHSGLCTALSGNSGG